MFINFCSESSLKSATDCFQTERQIQQDAWGSARIARVSTFPQMLEKEQRPSNNSSSLNRMEILCLASYAWSYFETFIQSPNSFWLTSGTGGDMGQFDAGAISKAVPSFSSSLTTVRERWRKTF